MRVRIAILLAALCLVAMSGFAEIRKDKRAGIQYDIPSWWAWEEREEGVILATKDGALVVMVWTPRGETIQEAVSMLDEELAKVIKNAKPNGKPQNGSLNGMQTISIAGTGRIGGARAEYSVIVLDAKRPVIVMAFGETGKYEKHDDALLGFVKTIRRIR
jgi:hypothetical protein